MVGGAITSTPSSQTLPEPQVDDLLFFGSGQPIAYIRPARLSERSELADDDVGELAVV
jgi:hypothetical protein